MFNLVVTNVPGPQLPLYADGALMLAAHPVVPLAKGQALSIGVTSYNGGMFFGLNADRDAMADVDVLAECINSAIDELLETVPDEIRSAAGATPRTVDADAVDVEAVLDLSDDSHDIPVVNDSLDVATPASESIPEMVKAADVDVDADPDTGMPSSPPTDTVNKKKKQKKSKSKNRAKSELADDSGKAKAKKAGALGAPAPLPVGDIELREPSQSASAASVVPVRPRQVTSAASRSLVSRGSNELRTNPVIRGSSIEP